MNIPSSLRAGDTWTWTDDLPDYPAATYTLKYTIYKYGQAAVTYTASGSGTTYVTSVTAANTVGIVQGEWGWTAAVEKGAGGSLERYTLGDGTITIKPSLAGASATTDLRSHAQIVLDALNAVLEGRATHADSAMKINGREIQYMTPKELLAWQNVYEKRVRSEKGGNNLVRIQFGEA